MSLCFVSTAKLNKNQVQHGSPAPSTMASAGIGTPPPVKESFVRRYKFFWPLLLAANFSFGAYLLTRTRHKTVGAEETELLDASATITDTPHVVAPVPRAPIPEDQQRELFKWILEEKRKVKPRDAEEKKRIDEEKAILKQFIRAKSIPSL
ncbi:hypothetical protein ACJIZ3_020471 [Penstemon smallii]|uniref:Transmembrane protein n=1 Tax=Penstemon smallii TaxID=265156 RepID=A0ABD3SIX9_9LAMI